MEPSPPKYPRTPHWPESLSIHRDDSCHSDPKFFLDKEVVITEKIDGGGVSLFNGKVYARSTGQEATAGWFAMVKKHHAYKTYGDLSKILYVEDFYGVHSITYEPVFENETCRMFNVRDLENDCFLSWDEVEAASITNLIKLVPVVYKGKFRNIKDITKFFKDERKKPSALGGEREGFVMRIAEAFPVSEFGNNVAKFVRLGHVQTDEHWTMNWQPCKLKKN